MSETVAPHSPQPWYRYGYVWLVISGPLAVVLAGLGTAWLALAYPDPQVAADHFRRGASSSAANPARSPEHKALVPAQQGRNHALTPSPTQP